MTKSTLLDSLFPATRQAILAATLMHPERWWYLSDLARRIGCKPSSLQRELAQLVEAGILLRRVDGNRVYFSPDPACPVLQELRSIMTKTAGLADLLRKTLKPFQRRIDLAFVYGSVARAEERSGSDVDLMIVGRVGLAELAGALEKTERRLDRPINPQVYVPDEFREKAGQGHHFINNVLKQDKIFLIGSQDDLATITGRKQDSTAHHKRARAGRSAGARRA